MHAINTLRDKCRNMKELLSFWRTAALGGYSGKAQVPAPQTGSNPIATPHHRDKDDLHLLSELSPHLESGPAAPVQDIGRLTVPNTFSAPHGGWAPHLSFPAPFLLLISLLWANSFAVLPLQGGS